MEAKRKIKPQNPRLSGERRAGSPTARSFAGARGAAPTGDLADLSPRGTRLTKRSQSLPAPPPPPLAGPRK